MMACSERAEQIASPTHAPSTRTAHPGAICTTLSGDALRRLQSHLGDRVHE
jgi:hypothetical protein